MELSIRALSIVSVCLTCAYGQKLSDPADALKAELEDMKVQLSNATDKLNKLEAYVASHVITHGSFQEDSGLVLPSEVLFSVQLQSPQNNLQVGSTLKYDRVLTNVANGYDPSTGIFTVPKSGQYLLSFFIRALGSGKMSVVLKVDGVVMVSGMADDDDSAGNMFIGVLSLGQQVWIETAETDSQSYHALYTTFSGMRSH